MQRFRTFSACTLAFTPTGRPLVLVDLPPLGVVRTPHVAKRYSSPFGRADRATVRLTVSEESPDQTCSTEVEHVEGLPAEPHRETRTGERYPRCLPSSSTHLRLGTDVILTAFARHLVDQVTLVVGSTPLAILALRSSGRLDGS